MATSCRPTWCAHITLSTREKWMQKVVIFCLSMILSKFLEICSLVALKRGCRDALYCPPIDPWFSTIHTLSPCQWCSLPCWTCGPWQQWPPFPQWSACWRQTDPHSYFLSGPASYKERTDGAGHKCVPFVMNNNIFLNEKLKIKPHLYFQCVGWTRYTTCHLRWWPPQLYLIGFI